MMKTTAEMISVMQAYADGKTIECQSNVRKDGWEDCPDPVWNWDYCDYRIKPEPKYSPYVNAEECYRAIGTHGGWVLDREGGFHLIISMTDYHVWLRGNVYCYADFLSDFVWADDGTPCGVLMEE